MSKDKEDDRLLRKIATIMTKQLRDEFTQTQKEIARPLIEAGYLRLNSVGDKYTTRGI